MASQLFWWDQAAGFRAVRIKAICCRLKDPSKTRDAIHVKKAHNAPATPCCVQDPTNVLGDSIETSLSCATRDTPLATLGGRCQIACDKPTDLRKVVISQIQLLSAPASYQPPPKDIDGASAGANPKPAPGAGGTAGTDATGKYLDPVYCQMQLTSPPLAGECQLRAYATCCQP